MDQPAQNVPIASLESSATLENVSEDGFGDDCQHASDDNPSQGAGLKPYTDAQVVEAANDDHAIDLPDYDITMLTLADLQVEYGETFADLDVPAAQAFAQRKALKHEMAIEYQLMVATAIKTFHARTRCPTCKQTPLTIDYFAMNHSLPKGAWLQWRELLKKIEAQKPEILSEMEWIEFLGEIKTIEMWYWEDNTASVECGRVSWNGNFAPYPVSSNEDRNAVNATLLLPARSYSKAVVRQGKTV